METRDYESGDEIRILELFETVFGRKMSLEYWKWRFEDNPAGKHMIKLMWDGETLAGHYAVSPVVVRIDDRKHLTALSMTTMTHPDYFRMGIFGKLANALYDDLEQQRNVRMIWGFPNNNSHYGFVKNLDWLDVGVVHMLGTDVSNRKPRSARVFKVADAFEDDHFSLLQKVSGNFALSVVRDRAYFDWRYLEQPTQRYSIFECRDGGLGGFAVAKLFKTGENPDTYEIFIMELGFAENFELLPDLIDDMIDFYAKPVGKVNIWTSLWDPRYRWLEKAGFVPGGRTSYLGARPSAALRHTASDFRNWFFSFGDSDVY